jgi:hypothetical protein
MEANFNHSSKRETCDSLPNSFKNDDCALRLIVKVVPIVFSSVGDFTGRANHLILFLIDVKNVGRPSNSD